MSGQTQPMVIRNSTVMRWINTNTVKCVSHEVDGHIVKSAGHEMDGHIVKSAGHEVDGHIVKSTGHEMDGHKHCQKCLQVMRWKDTNTVKSV